MPFGHIIEDEQNAVNCFCSNSANSIDEYRRVKPPRKPLSKQDQLKLLRGAFGRKSSK